MEEATKEDKIWRFDPFLSCLPFCSTQNVDNNARHVDVPKVQATGHVIAAGHPDDQKFVIRMEEATGDDKIWGFDPDLSCLLFGASQSVDNNSRCVDAPKVQTTSHASAQPFQPEKKIAETRGASLPLHERTATEELQNQ
ncbi:hypothetical protein N7481_010274 [Penicillium waksmanii]|uniref:uncharacterized protein n=1 Tax=Penicillium waksmanii TaxID=69791 RepID=UPI00254739C0|nr:uncharacterized protein N7481_010274 [Penicillium waksmanii]KAJ5976567.1 hypothetical protein N7481_010274 [Penicillium waksmanii]